MIEALEDSEILPNPFNIGIFINRVEERRGRPIRLVAMSGSHNAPCGLYVKTKDTDFLCYTRSKSPLHQCHIILHELGHLLLDHHDSGWRSEDLHRLLLPDLDPKMIKSVLCRNGYVSPNEDEAETFAELILAPRALTHDFDTMSSTEPPPDIADVIRNIERAWGAQVGGLRD
ncbi:ImmA/IrrE family metallo-endopeptidase [Nonomuraea sp. K274]|uniref:ImmA/IrrE family metallo-endopeptidase n=1 Tax=Nonomuraea cypriaca TaxID=1187855 RepID=A0A931A6H4_9ACTN|nr:ImmA/IrrE family metallo-endopeptidase [Nonomuraea cypriaca]MBF8184938.1 ImmA/IrrE family metallo-endopeptidase [Nonomuraea cypriaca]